MQNSPDVVVIGGGVIGCAIAYELAKRKVRVLVLESGVIGSGATQASAGMIAPLSDTQDEGPLLDLAVRSFRIYHDFLTEVEDASGMTTECRQIGIIRTATQENEIQAIQGSLEIASALGLEMHWLEISDLRKLEPQLGPSVVGGTFSPQEPNLNPLRLVEALRRAATSYGAEFREHAPVSDLVREKARIIGAQLGRDTILGEQFVLATGAWACQASNWLELELPISPVRGQVAYVDKLEIPLQHTVMNGLTYAAPKADGTTLLGTTLEHAGFDQRVTTGGLATILENVQRLVPAFSETSLTHTRAGLRPLSTDGLPILGLAPGNENIVIAGGHYRSGILLSAISSKIIGDLITNGPTAVDLGPFDASRLGKM